MNKIIFARKIAEWYNDNKRKLPWRETADPYRIWLSEIILQQTRVAQGLPYYLRFVDRFPDISSLAKAREQEVLRLWQGLGYYSRARHLHRCAKMIAHQGQFPSTFEDLKKLPGIGAYTAAAIASLAFLEPVAVVDGNVYRVLSRIFGDENDIASTEGKKHFFQKAQSLISPQHPDIHNQAMMEFGALQCVPKNPNCMECVFKKQCVAFANGWVDRLPFKSKKTAVRQRYFYYFVIEHGKKWAMKRRAGKDIWHGLYDFYLVETSRHKKPGRVLAQDPFLQVLAKEIRPDQIQPPYTQLLSHQKLLAYFIPLKIKLTRGRSALLKRQNIRFYSSVAIQKLPKPVLVSRYLHDRTFL